MTGITRTDLVHNGIALRETMPASPRAVTVLHAGTLGTPQHMDILAAKWADMGIGTIAMGPISDARRATEHLERLDDVVRFATTRHPDVPLAVAGTSLGADWALGWRALYGSPNVPVVAFNPVAMEKMLPIRDRLEVAKSVVSRRLGRTLVNTPMSLGIPLTTNADSLTHASRLVNAKSMKVPAALFGDTAKVLTMSVLARASTEGPLAIALAGADQTAVNGASKLLGRVLGASKIWTVPGAAHDLTQLAESAVARRTGEFILRMAR